MAKVMIWPDIYREQGHWLPAINLAKSLKTDGHTPEFMGIPDCASIVAPYEATFHTIFEDIYEIGHSVENKIEPIGQRWKPVHLFPMARGALDSLFTGPNKPDLLVFGYFAALEALILRRKYGVKIVGLTTYLRHPQEDPAIFAKSKLIHMDEPVVDKLLALVSPNEELSLDAFVEPLYDAQELIPCPRDFDFFDRDWEHRENVHYVEPMIERLTLGSNQPETTAENLHNPIPPPEAGKKIIFGTAGSQVDDYEDKARRFFHALIGMMKTQGMENHHLVLSMGTKLMNEFLIYYGVDENRGENSLPPNVTLASWVSQLDIMQNAQAVFMHGGLATIKEAIYEEVPIVIFPHGKDQDENALRIRRTGVGIYPEVDVLTPTVLRELLTQVTSSPWIRKKLAGMKQLFHDADGAANKPSVAVINGVLNPPTP